MSKPTSTSFDAIGNLTCLATLLCWSTGPIFIEYLTGYLDMWTQNLLRYACACLFWLPFLLMSWRTGRLESHVWKWALLPAAANIVMQSLWAGAFYYIEPAFAVLLSKTSLIWIVIFSVIYFPEERPLVASRRFWLGLLLSAAGVIGVLVNQEGFGQRYTTAGTIIILLCALMWGVYTVSVKIAFKKIDSRIGFSVISIYTVGGLFALTLAFGRVEDSAAMPAGGWAAVVISGVVAIGLGHVFYYASIHRLGATIPSLVLLCQPFTVLAASYLFFGESLNTGQWFFGIVLLAGSGIAIWAQQHLKSSTATERPNERTS